MLEIHTEIRDGIVYRSANGRESTFWVDCGACGKRQPAGTGTLTDYDGKPFTHVEHLSSRWAKPQIGRCSVCYAEGPLVEIKRVTRKGQQAQCDRRCLEATGDECNCSCEARCHSAGVCSCKKETAC